MAAVVVSTAPVVLSEAAVVLSMMTRAESRVALEVINVGGSAA